MVDGILRDPDGLLDLPEPRTELAAAPEHLKKHRRLGALQESFFHFALDPLHGKAADIDGPHEIHGLLRHAEAQAGRKLRRPKHPQRILRKTHRIHVPDDALPDVLPAAEMIDDLTAQNILHERVHGEVPAAGRRLSANERVHVHLEIPVAAAHRPLPSGERHIDVEAFERIYAEAGAKSQRLAEVFQQLEELLRLHPVDLDVDVRGAEIALKHPVADEAAHIICASAPLRHAGGDLLADVQLLLEFFHLNILATDFTPKPPQSPSPITAGTGVCPGAR